MLSPGTSISLCTTRLVCKGPRGSSVGTGYHYIFELADSFYVPVIITNKHVVEGAERLEATLPIMIRGTVVSEDGKAAGEMPFELGINGLQEIVIPHPDKDVDLCAILCGNWAQFLPPGYDFRILPLTKNWHIPKDGRAHVRPIEPIMMVGYPSGLWDQLNNRPIARQGRTASHALIAWNGRREFLIDAACFPGSSGSPVFLFEDGMVRNGNSYSPGTRAQLIGTLWGGPTYSATGEMVPAPIPTSADVPVVPVMMNLGYVIHADALDDLIPLIAEKVGAAQ